MLSFKYRKPRYKINSYQLLPLAVNTDNGKHKNLKLFYSSNKSYYV